MRAGLTGCGFFLAAIALPMAQIRLGEETSFQKHLAFTALLLSYPAAVALHRWSQQRWRYGPVGAVLVLLFVTGVARSDALFTS
ncbi:MAG: hypothetical protein LCH82_13285 [Actinobacteria bacterium]|nr:hypothetical protein [Actinomycetota bacterium]HRW01375.1 hypothetical protein [Tetrasphaera sp.]